MVGVRHVLVLALMVFEIGLTRLIESQVCIMHRGLGFNVLFTSLEVCFNPLITINMFVNLLYIRGIDRH